MKLITDALRVELTFIIATAGIVFYLAIGWIFSPTFRYLIRRFLLSPPRAGARKPT